MRRCFLIFMIALGFCSCQEQSSSQEEGTVDILEGIQEELRIVSLSGGITEILFSMGLENKIVGVDVTSTFPEGVQSIANVGQTRQLSTEGVISLEPNLVLGFEDEIDQTILDQFSSVGITVKLLPKPVKIEDSYSYIESLASFVNQSSKGDEIITKLKSELELFEPSSEPKKVLFIYARGLGTLMVGGKGTAQGEMIEKVGAVNAANDHFGFKTLTAESLVDANPDVILMFNSGFESLNATNDLMNVPGISETNAGMNSAFVTMNGQLISCFGPRTPEALIELKEKIFNN